MTGPTYALSNVVMPRSCSRSSGHTSRGDGDVAAGKRRRSASAITCSCAGLAQECRKQTATALGLRAGDLGGQRLGCGRVERDQRRASAAFIRSGASKVSSWSSGGRDRLEEQVVAVLLDARFATEPEEVAEALGRDERHVRRRARSRMTFVASVVPWTSRVTAPAAGCRPAPAPASVRGAPRAGRRPESSAP